MPDKPVHSMKIVAKQPRKRKPIYISTDESGVDGEPVEEINSIVISVIEPVTIPAVVITVRTTVPTSTDNTTTPTAFTSTRTLVMDQGLAYTRYLVW